jgi:diguanylate cyclase (GGDEF)-like protein/PAS domain S-box-containing protein
MTAASRSDDLFSLALLDALFEDAPVGLAVFDREIRYARVNPPLAAISGTEPEAMVGRTPAELHGEIGVTAMELYRSVIDGGPPLVGMEIAGRRPTHPDEQGCWSVHAFPVRAEGRIEGCCVIVLDVSERAGLEAELRHRAAHDGMTGLPNRGVLLDRLGLALERARRGRSGVAVLFCDVDGLKAVNDHFGHAGGDAVLRTVGERLCATIRAEDTAARWGGDEFVVLVEQPPGPGAVEALIERLYAAMGEPVVIEGVPTTVGVSIGAAYAAGYEDAAALLRRADAAMYTRKAAG